MISNEKDRYSELIRKLRADKVIEKIEREQTKINSLFKLDKTLNTEDNYFLCLRKWNSFTPLLSNINSTIGGGYFIAWNKQGIVIDPGINFITRFLYLGYSILDINAVIVTHSHVDHTSDIESLLTLLHETNSLLRERDLPPHKIDLYLNIGTLTKFMNILSYSYDNINKLIIVNQSFKGQIFNDLTLRACPAIHYDLCSLAKNTCYGIVLESKGETILGITSDTKYNIILIDNYITLKNKLLVLHIGSIKEDELIEQDRFKGLYENHLGIKGVFNLIDKTKPKLAIISELGEELKEILIDTCRSLDEFFDDVKIIPGDINLKIKLINGGGTYDFYCEECEKFQNIDKIYCYEEDGNIKYRCNDH